MEKEQEREKSKAEKTLRVFWKDVKYFLKSKTPNLTDIARFMYNVRDEIIPADLQDAEKKVPYILKESFIILISFIVLVFSVLHRCFHVFAAVHLKSSHIEFV